MKLKLIPNQCIIQRLNVAVNSALNSSPQTGCDFLITLDMRESAKRRNFWTWIADASTINWTFFFDYRHCATHESSHLFGSNGLVGFIISETGKKYQNLLIQRRCEHIDADQIRRGHYIWKGLISLWNSYGLLPLVLYSVGSNQMNSGNFQMQRTKASLSLPFKYVDKNSKNTIFLTIVDSVARISGVGEAPIDQFRLYRKTNTHSK